MEDWQRKHITKNLPVLMKVTDFNDEVQAELLANDILSDTDVEALDTGIAVIGKSSASYKFYKCLMTRVGAYEVLMKTLQKCKQTGAVKILKNGMRIFGIPKKLDGFKDVEIVIQGVNRKLSDFFPTDKLELVRKIFEETISEVKFIDWFVKKSETFVLATSTIPPEPPIYIPRFISNRIEISMSVFKVDCPDIFVFSNNIERWKLSEIAKPNWTASSNDQLNQITARFIHLDEYEDWIELKKKANVPIHLINYDCSQKSYILEDSSRALEILSRIGSKKQRAYMSEGEFIQQQLSEDLKASSVCICDKPGMGKTYLLANVSRILHNKCNRTIIVFIQLSTFEANFTASSPNTTKQQDAAISDVLKYVSPSPEHAELLRKLVEEKLLRVEIFFDGFDEIREKDWMKLVFLRIKCHLPNVRMYVTSRPHMRHELEKSLGVIAYDILPFNIENQVDYIFQFWSPKYPQLDHTAVRNYALYCVEEINKTLSETDKEITGIPLLCRLIAEIYSKKVRFYVTTKAKNVYFPLQIAAMYQQFIQKRTEAVTQNEDELMNIKLVHIFHALKLLFPKDGFHNNGIFDMVNELDASSDVLKAGIMYLESNSKLEFIHRTFAEYFVSEYFSVNFQSTTQKPKAFIQNEADKSQQVVISILNHLLSTKNIYVWNTRFVNSVIVSFVDFNFNEIRISEETTSTIAVYCASLSPENLLSILCSCCRHNLLRIFAFLKEALRKWDWNQKNEYFTKEDCFKLLKKCIEVSTSQMFHSCIQLFTEVLGLDVERIAVYDRWDTLLHIAAENANYEALEYLIDRVSFELSGVLQNCVKGSYYSDADKIKRKTDILKLLHNKCPSLINKNSDILAAQKMHVSLFKTLVKLGANVTAVDFFGNNCLMNAMKYMSPIHFHELVGFLLTDCKAEYLFFSKREWGDPVQTLIEKRELLPETLELLLNIPGININKKDNDGENLLFRAVRGNKLGNLEQLVNRGHPNERNKFNKSLLHLAAMYGDEKMVHYVLSLNLDVNSRDVFESTPIHYAADNPTHSFSVVKTLVQNGANLQAKTDRGRTALHLFASNNHHPNLDAIKYLIRNGAGVNDRDNNGNPPIHLCKTKEVRNCLIEMGADINSTDGDGDTLLHNIVRKSFASYDAIRDPISNESEVIVEYNFGGYARLHAKHLHDNENFRDNNTASRIDASCDEIKYLIRMGAGVNERDNNGNTPLHKFEDWEIMVCLVEMGADIHATNKSGQTVLHIATSRFDATCDKIEYLIRKGAGVNDRDNNGNTPLHFCLWKHVRDCLIENGADIHATNNNGQSVLHTIASKSFATSDEIKYLITNGLGVNDRDNNGNTPLHLGDTRIIRDCLIEMGADIFAINKNGQTVLHTTASQLSARCVEIKYLIKEGVGVNHRDNNGNTPLHLCKRKEVRDCLIEMGADIHVINKNQKCKIL